MARTKASVGAKVSSGKSSKARCSVAPPSSSNSSTGSSERSSRNHSGGNAVCPRETPIWQKPITNFFITKDGANRSMDNGDLDTKEATASTSRAKKNVIHSDDEDEQTDTDKPINKELDETLELEPLDDEDEQTDTDKPINKELDETLELEPLTGEASHTIDEYYPGNGVKGKGKGKKSKGKENVNGNIRSSLKRDFEDIAFGEESPQVTKKVKVN